MAERKGIFSNVLIALLYISISISEPRFLSISISQPRFSFLSSLLYKFPLLSSVQVVYIHGVFVLPGFSFAPRDLEAFKRDEEREKKIKSNKRIKIEGKRKERKRKEGEKAIEDLFRVSKF